ncbi:MAG: hypothetical protein ACK4SI_09185 [Brevundimonas aurantiaca]|jgi:hypothetical protein|uniref:hypothetical protein n=1 Tax=Brevundimonas aurantiaca TaxID=74316 RepID=UPI00191A1816|nr:hypothetical protein [Brevundimonas aurantiaca]
MTVSSPKTSRIPRRILVAFGIGAVLGAAGYVFGRSVLPQLIGPDALEGVELRWSDAMAALTGVALMVGAAAVILISFDLRRLAQMYGMEEPASAEEGRQARLQAAVMGFSGFILLLPMVFAVIGLAPAIALGLIVLLFAAHTALNLKVWGSVDELLRRATLEAATATFFLGQGLLFLWAAGERLGLLAPITAWDVYAVLMTLYLFVSAVVSTRRGLA